MELRYKFSIKRIVTKIKTIAKTKYNILKNNSKILIKFIN